MNYGTFGRQLVESVFAAQHTKTISAALNLGVFAALGQQSASAADLATQLSANQAILLVVLDACVCFGLLQRENERYALTKEARQTLLAGSPGYVGGVFQLFEDESQLWAGLPEMIQTGINPVRRDTPMNKRYFFDGVDGIGRAGEAQALAAQVPLASCKTLLDVGCGSGAYSKALCDAFPQLQVTALDQQWMLDMVQEGLAGYPQAHRIQLRVTNIRQDSFGGPFDAILLSDVLYSSERENIATLKLAYQALAPGACLIVRAVIPDTAVSDSSVPSMLEVSRLLRSGKSIPIWADDLESQMRNAGFTSPSKRRLTSWATAWISYRPRD